MTHTYPDALMKPSRHLLRLQAFKDAYRGSRPAAAMAEVLAAYARSEGLEAHAKGSTK